MTGEFDMMTSRQHMDVKAPSQPVEADRSFWLSHIDPKTRSVGSSLATPRVFPQALI